MGEETALADSCRLGEATIDERLEAFLRGQGRGGVQNPHAGALTFRFQHDRSIITISTRFSRLDRIGRSFYSSAVEIDHLTVPVRDYEVAKRSTRTRSSRSDTGSSSTGRTTGARISACPRSRARSGSSSRSSPGRSRSRWPSPTGGGRRVPRRGPRRGRAPASPSPASASVSALLRGAHRRLRRQRARGALPRGRVARVRPRSRVSSARASGSPFSARRGRAPGVGLIGFTVLLVVGLADGGFVPRTWRLATVAFLALLAASLIARQRIAVGRLEWAFLGALAAYAGWMELSQLWSDTPANSVLEGERAFLYVCAAAAVLLSMERSKCRCSWPARSPVPRHFAPTL